MCTSEPPGVIQAKSGQKHRRQEPAWLHTHPPSPPHPRQTPGGADLGQPLDVLFVERGDTLLDQAGVAVPCERLAVLVHQGPQLCGVVGSVHLGQLMVGIAEGLGARG